MQASGLESRWFFDFLNLAVWGIYLEICTNATYFILTESLAKVLCYCITKCVTLVISSVA